MLSVWLTVKRNVWCWPIGAVMVALYVIVFWREKLYADAALQAIYFVLQLYGWWEWKRGTTKNEVAIRALAWPWRLGAAVAGAGITIALGTTLSRYTDQAFPLADSFIAVFSLLAQALMAARYLENWPIWIVVDALAVGIYLRKSLYATSVLYAIFLLLAVAGWREWQHARETKQ